MEKIKSCPFCGYTLCEVSDYLVNIVGETVHHGVSCDCCGAVGGWSTDKEHAIEKWNKRQEKMSYGRVPNCT